MWQLSLNHKDFPSQNPPTEDGCVQCGLDCPFKCWAAFIVRWRQPDGKTALLYTMFPPASNEHNLSLESTAVLESKSINRFRNQTHTGFKRLKLCLALFFLAHSVIIHCMKKWMDERYNCNQQNQVCLLSGLTVVPSATQLHSVRPSWPSEASFSHWGAPENTSSTCRYMLIVTKNVSVLTPWIKAYNIHTLKFNAFKQPQTHWHCKRM